MILELNLLFGTWQGAGIELHLEKESFRLIQHHQQNEIKGLWWLKSGKTTLENPPQCISASINAYHFSCFLEWAFTDQLPSSNQSDMLILRPQTSPSKQSPTQTSLVLIVRLRPFFP
jgi:hypothetical protein